LKLSQKIKNIADSKLSGSNYLEKERFKDFFRKNKEILLIKINKQRAQKLDYKENGQNW